MRRGSSGAVITAVGDDVTKRQLGPAGERIAEQGRWLQRYSSPAVPLVLRVYEHSYVMERLIVPPFRLLDHKLVLQDMIGQLSRHVWSQPAIAPINHDMLQRKLEGLVRDYPNFAGTWPWITKTVGEVRWVDLPRCLTHGDPTFDNVLIREDTGEVVLADPLPATLVVPDLRCVDIGKVLTSVLGWERVRYDESTFQFNVTVNDLRNALTSASPQLQVDLNEWRASVLWAVIHLLRTLPYISETVRTRVRWLVGDTIALL